jgi:hypothetical protein
VQWIESTTLDNLADSIFDCRANGGRASYKTVTVLKGDIGHALSKILNSFHATQEAQCCCPLIGFLFYGINKAIGLVWNGPST